MKLVRISDIFWPPETLIHKVFQMFCDVVRGDQQMNGPMSRHVCLPCVKKLTHSFLPITEANLLRLETNCRFPNSQYWDTSSWADFFNCDKLWQDLLKTTLYGPLVRSSVEKHHSQKIFLLFYGYFSEKPPSDERLEDTELLRLDLTEESPLTLLWALEGGG